MKCRQKGVKMKRFQGDLKNFTKLKSEVRKSEIYKPLKKI